MKMLKMIKRMKEIRNGNMLPILYCNLNIHKFRSSKDGSCEVNIHPVIYNNLESKQRELLHYHMEQVIDILRDNIIDVEDLR